MLHVYENQGLEVPDELREKQAKMVEERERVVGELSEILEALGDIDEQQQLQVQLQSKQLVRNLRPIFVISLSILTF